MKRDAFTIPLAFPGELIIDNFAGGGGTSTGLERAFGRPVDIAINHDPEALAMHAINHPHTQHLCESVWEVDPIKVTGNQPLGLVWLSPDCKHFSKAKGGTPVAKHIRGLAWVGMRWVAKCKPRVMMLENVEEFTTWGPLLVGADGTARPDPARKGQTFDSFVRQLRAHGYAVEWTELRACDHATPTIRKRLFLIARRDGLPIQWPHATHGAPDSKAVLAGKLAPYRTAAECIDFTLPANSIFGRKKELATNTQRRVAKGLWRHVLSSASPFIVNTANSKTTGRGPNAWTADEPLRTVTSSNGFAAVAPTITPLRGTTEAHLGGHDILAPLSTVAASGTHHALVAGHITKFNTGSIGTGLDEPLSTITAGGTPKRPSTGITQGMVGAHLVTAHIQRDMGCSIGHAATSPLGTTTAGGGGKSALVAAHLTHLTHHGERSGHSPAEPLRTVTGAHRGEQALIGANLVTIGYGERPGQDARTQDIRGPLGTAVAGGVKQGVVAATLVDMGHGEGQCGTKRFSHGVRNIVTPLNAITASGGTSALVTACLEQANGGFYDGDGRPADAPVSTITAAGSNQRLITAYAVKYYSSGGQWQGLGEPMHTLPTKGRMGLVQVVQVSAESIAPEHRERARQCAQLLHTHLPEQFPEPADLVLMQHAGAWWALVDITLRMLKPRELFRAQGFPEDYVIHEIPNPALLFQNGKQAAHPLEVPRIPLTATAQVRMCGNSVCPPMAEALVRANFAHEARIYGIAA